MEIKNPLTTLASDVRCTVCTHPARPDIEALMARGNVSLRQIARDYGLSAPAMTRHQRHAGRALVAARVAKEVEDISALYMRMKRRSEALWDKALEIAEVRPELFHQYAEVARKHEEMLAKFARLPGYDGGAAPTTVNAPDARIVITSGPPALPPTTDAKE